MEAVWNWFAWLYQEYGINLVVFYNAYDRGMFFNGLYLTVQMSVICIVLSTVIGAMGAWLQGSALKIPPIDLTVGQESDDIKCFSLVDLSRQLRKS